PGMQGGVGGQVLPGMQGVGVGGVGGGGGGGQVLPGMQGVGVGGVGGGGGGGRRGIGPVIVPVKVAVGPGLRAGAGFVGVCSGGWVDVLVSPVLPKPVLPLPEPPLSSLLPPESLEPDESLLPEPPLPLSPPPPPD